MKEPKHQTWEEAMRPRQGEPLKALQDRRALLAVALRIYEEHGQSERYRVS